MATDANSLLEAAKCYACLSEWPLLKLGLLKQILLANNPVADTSVNTLLDQAKCYACLTPGFWPLLELALLQQIVNAGGGGGGGSGSVLKGTGNPNGVVTSTVTAAIFYDPIAGSIWEFNGAANTNVGWVQIV